MNQSAFFNCWVVVTPSADVSGQWVAHNLEFDVVSQGESLKHALDMLGEASHLVAEDDLASGRNPALRQAPKECFDELYDVIGKGNLVRLGDVLTGNSSNLRALVVQMRLGVQLATGPADRPVDTMEMPLSWSVPKGTGPVHLNC